MQELESLLIDPRAKLEYRKRVAARLESLRATLASVIPEDVAEFSWEIGCGHGHFLTKYASGHPERFFVGIDILADRLRKAGRKQVVAGLENTRFIKAEALEFLDCLPDRLRIAEVLVLFPDPWPKKRHHKNRLIQAVFLDRLARRMIPGGCLYFRTDYEPYLSWTRELLSRSLFWNLLPDAPWVLDEPTVFQAKAQGFGSLVASLKTPSSARRTTG